MRLPPEAVQPLVFDTRIGEALLALRKRFPEDLNEINFPWLKVTNGKEYESYCSCIKDTASLMNQVENAPYHQWDAYKLEQLLYEQTKKIA